MKSNFVITAPVNVLALHVTWPLGKNNDKYKVTHVFGDISLAIGDSESYFGLDSFIFIWRRDLKKSRGTRSHIKTFRCPLACFILPGIQYHTWHDTTRHDTTRHDTTRHDIRSLIVRFMGPKWGPSEADKTQIGPMLAPWTLLYGRYDMIWYDMIWYDMIRYDTIRYEIYGIWNMIYDIRYMIYDWYVIYDMLWHDTMWYEPGVIGNVELVGYSILGFGLQEMYYGHIYAEESYHISPFSKQDRAISKLFSTINITPVGSTDFLQIWYCRS